MITPIEMYTMIPKSAEASNLKQQQAARNVDQQGNLAQNMDKTIQHNSSQTVKSAKADNPEYRYDSQGKGGAYSGNGGRQKKQKDEKETKEERKLPPGCFDVRI